MASEAEDFEARVQKALKDGLPLNDFPDASPLMSLTMAYNEAVGCFEQSGFKRGEAIWLAAAMFCGNPGAGPVSPNS